MISRAVNADHEGEEVIIRNDQGHKIASMSPEDAVVLAHDLLDHADKVLAHQGVID